MTTPPPKTRFAILLVSILMDFIGFGIIMPILPFYAQSFGATPLYVGLLLGVFPLVGIITPLLWGQLSDRIGRHPALLLNIAGSALSYFLLSMAHSLWMLFLARIIAGASSASIVIAQSYVSDLTTTENRTQTLSWLEAASGIGIVIGLMISGLLVGNTPTSLNYRAPLVVATIVSSLTLVLVGLYFPSINKQRQPLKPWHHEISRFSFHHAVTDLRTIFQRPLVSGLMLMMFVMLFAIIGIESIFALWCEIFFGWGPQQFSALVIFYFSIVSILQIGLTGRLAKWIGEPQLLRYSLVLLAMGLVLRPFSTTLPLLLGSLLFVICAEAVGIPTLTSLLSRLSGAKQQGKTLGLMQSVAGLGGGLGASSAGFLFGSVGSNAPYWISAIIISSVTILCWKYITPSRLLRVIRRRQRAKVIRLFELLDRDNSGTIELKDFKQTTQHLAISRGWLPQTLEYQRLQTFMLGFGQRLQQLADQDGNQHIDRKEWRRYLDEVPDHDLAMLFLQMIDANGDGQISMEELRSFYDVYDITTEELEEVFRTLDLNQDGHISHDEFKVIFTQFLYSDDIQSPGTWMFGVNLPRQL